ncbi:MAG TPA: hypothetical protein VKS24_07370 [Bradyrhizobium sp.]|nr:hypothetical protein [Bradyrhizobium sp.]
MEKTCWKIAASIGLILFSQTASAEPSGRAAVAAGAYINISQDNSSFRLLAQAGEPAASATTPAPKGPQDQPAPASPSPSNPTAKAPVVKPGPTAVGCGLKYLTAEISGKLKGRKWKEFRDQECGPISTHAVFPSEIAPKYSGENPDKARTLTCVDQFNANKATNANDGLRWIDKGGGYYSECVARLKG